MSHYDEHIDYHNRKSKPQNHILSCVVLHMLNEVTNPFKLDESTSGSTFYLCLRTF